MRENWTKEEILLEEQKQEKRKIYKNWKFYTGALGIIVIGTGVGLGAGLGIKEENNLAVKTTIPFENLELTTTITEITVTNQEDAFQAFLDLNKEKYPDLEGNVESGIFVIGHGEDFTTLVINAKANSKYTGIVLVYFPALLQISLNDLELVTKLNDSYIQKDKAFQAFLDLNKEKYPDLEANVEISDFKHSTYQNLGSLEITGIGKYTNTVTIEIPGFDLPINLNQFDGYDNGELLVNKINDDNIKDAIINKIIEIAKIPSTISPNLIKAAISMSLNYDNTAVTITPSFIGSITGQVKGKAIIYFTIATN